MITHTYKLDFPLLEQKAHGKPLVYLDTASSAQKPGQVIRAVSDFYENDYANIHRGIYALSHRATKLYEDTRDSVKQFINAAHREEIVFVRGTTEAINLAAESYGRSHLKSGDEIILSEAEHHSNIVPWHLLSDQMGVVIKVAPIKDDGSLDLAAYKKLFTGKTKIVAITHASNVTGVVNPVKEITAIAHAQGAVVLLDGAQAIAHMPVDVQDIDCDFYCFSGHKLYGPTGVGVLYAKQHLLQAMPPYQGGGGMIETVDFSHITYAKPPYRFEAGTPNIAGVVGLGAAIAYVKSIGFDTITACDESLLRIAEQKLQAIPGLKIIGTAHPKVSAISFVIDKIHPHDVGTVLEHEGIAIRAGHHCAMPLMARFNVPATVRASFGIYNTENDIDALIEGILLAKRLFA